MEHIHRINRAINELKIQTVHSKQIKTNKTKINELFKTNINIIEDGKSDPELKKLITYLIPYKIIKKGSTIRSKTAIDYE